MSDGIEFVVTPKEHAESLLATAAEVETKKAALIAELTAQRQNIDEALVALGAKRKRKVAEPKRKGRPPGSKNRPAPAPQPGSGTADEIVARINAEMTE